MKTPNSRHTRSRLGEALAKSVSRSSLATACGLLVLVGTAQSGSAQSLALRYTFDEASGPAVDTSGKDAQANGTFSGTGARTTTTPGGYPGAAFDAGSGGGGYIDAGDADKLDAPAKLTITAWIRLYGNPNNGGVILSKQDAGNTTGYSLLYGLPSGGSGSLAASDFTVKLRVGSTASNVSADLDADNKWIFVAVTYDGTTGSSNLRFYNGDATTPVGSATTRNYTPGIPAANSEHFQICASASTAATVSVMLDDVRIYTNVLPQAQLETIRQDNLPPTLWWDRSGNTPGATNGPDGVADGVWSGSGVWTAGNNWSSSSAGDFVTQEWSDGSVAVFAAGADATGSYTVTVSNAPTATAINIEEGTVLFNRGSVTLTGGASIDVASGASATFDSTTIAGSAGLTKTDAGTLELNGDNTYTGPTTVSNGTLLVNGSLASTDDVTVESGATLGGSGTVPGPVVVHDSGNISPGASAGILTLQNGLDLSTGGTYVWELTANSTATAGSDFDQIALTGGDLVLGGSSVLSINFSGAAAAPDASVPFWQTTQTWLIVSLGGTASNPGDAKFASLLNASYSAGTFSTSTDGSGQIVLTFVPTPPSPTLELPVIAGGNVTLTWGAISGNTYQVEYNTNLNTTNWTTLTNVMADGSTASAMDIPGSDPARFYRVMLVP